MVGLLPPHVPAYYAALNWLMPSVTKNNAERAALWTSMMLLARICALDSRL